MSQQPVTLKIHLQQRSIVNQIFALSYYTSMVICLERSLSKSPANTLPLVTIAQAPKTPRGKY